MAKTKRKRPPLTKWQKRRGAITGLMLGIILAVIISAATSSGHSAPSGPFNGSSTKLVAATTAAINNADASPGLAKPPHAGCFRTNSVSGLICVVTYTIKEPAGINFGDETILPSTGVFKYAFSDPSVSGVTVMVSGPATSIGGQTSTSKLFDLTCNQQSNSQIDWSNVSVSGLKQLCDFTQFVNDP